MFDTIPFHYSTILIALLMLFDIVGFASLTVVMFTAKPDITDPQDASATLDPKRRTGPREG